MAAEAMLIATVGKSEKREAASSVMTIAIKSAGLSLTKYGAITEMSTHPGTTSKIWRCLLLKVLFLSNTYPKTRVR